MQFDWSVPLNLEQVRCYFEKYSGNDFPSEDVSNNMVVLGILTGYQATSIDSCTREVHFSISQGGNTELRFSYLGKFS